VILPEYLDPDLWNEWLEYRKTEKRKPAGPIAQKRALEKLSRFWEAGFDVNAILKDAMIAGWQGLFTTRDTPRRALAIEEHRHGYDTTSAAGRVRQSALRAVGGNDGYVRDTLDESVRGNAVIDVAPWPGRAIRR